MKNTSLFIIFCIICLQNYAQKEVDMIFPFLQGAVSEVFTDKNILVEGEIANLEVQVAKENVDAFQYDGIKAYDCSWALQQGYGTFTHTTGGKTTFQSPPQLPVASAVATITATLTPTVLAQNKAQKAGFSFPKVILYIRIQETSKNLTVLSLDEEVFTVELKSNIQSPENMMSHYQQKYGANLTPEQKAQFEAANAQIAAAKAKGDAKASAASADLMAMSMNQVAMLKEGRLIITIHTGGSYFSLKTGTLETAKDIVYTFVLDKSKGVGTYTFPGTYGSLSADNLYCAYDADGNHLEGTSGVLVIEEMGNKPGEKVKGTIHADISNGITRMAHIDDHFVVVIGSKE